MRFVLSAVAALVLGGCAGSGGGDDVTIRTQEKLNVSRAGFLPGQSRPPAERNGVWANDTGVIVFVCANSPQHEDREVVISTCPKCGERNYFYFDHARQQLMCYACETPVPDSVVKCEICGAPPRRIRTKNAGH
jgi:ribosomal protein S27E